MSDRPDVPDELVHRIGTELTALPECVEQPAWTGVMWRVGPATIAHVFGGEDQRFRIVFRTEPEEVPAFENLGDPYFRAGWGANVVGMLLDERTDWVELSELLTDSYCVQVPARLAQHVRRPPR